MLEKIFDMICQNPTAALLALTIIALGYFVRLYVTSVKHNETTLREILPMVLEMKTFLNKLSGLMEKCQRNSTR